MTIETTLPTAAPVYKTVQGAALQLHTYRPADWQARDRRPAIVFFFGGGWRTGTPESFYPYCARLAQMGMVAMAADYRVAERHGVRPQECAQDAKSAVRWIRAHAGELGVDPARLAAGGGSAGGHLALCCLLCPGGDDPADDLTVSAVPDATATINPVADVPGFDVDGSRCGSRAAGIAISPAHHVQGGRGPSILFHGERDELVPIGSVQKFGAEMQAAGNRFEVVVRAGQQHGFYKYKEGQNPEFFAVAEGIERFFRGLWL